MRGNRLSVRPFRRGSFSLTIIFLFLFIAVLLVSTSCQKTPTPPPPPPPPAATTRPTTVPTPAPTATARPATPAPTQAPTPVPAPATLDIPVTVRGASNLGSLQLELRFDPQALELKDVKAGPLARNALVDSKISAPGRVQIGLVAASGISGDGGVVMLTFAPVGKAGPVSLTVEQLQAADTDLRDLVVTTSAGQFSGTGSQATGPVLSFRK
ncbi:MAG: cohesin domain-containing protein [Dehalococcoidia bacterium]|nr:cohesin domain-containing protein [Dehalococcoidia bacterium]